MWQRAELKMMPRRAKVVHFFETCVCVCRVKKLRMHILGARVAMCVNGPPAGTFLRHDSYHACRRQCSLGKSSMTWKSASKCLWRK